MLFSANKLTIYSIVTLIFMIHKLLVLNFLNKKELD